jgi:uncharacterized protein
VDVSTPRLLPAFPLGSVLVPGLVMPLHIFEPRYRAMVRDLLVQPQEQQEFVVVAIREGQEVGRDGVRAVHEIGTIASLQEVTPYEDGRFDIVTVGTERVRISDLTTTPPADNDGTPDAGYALVTVTPIAENPGEDADIVAAAVRSAFAAYRVLLTGADADATTDVDDLPDDPGVLSYLVAAALVLDLPDRQRLLEIPDDASRLRAELRRIRQEIALISAIPSLPAIDLQSTPFSRN